MNAHAAGLQLSCRRIVTPAGVIDGRVTIVDGMIIAVAAGAPTGIDLGDRWLVPGLIDTHVHGGAGAQCNTADPEEIAAVAAFHARHGTTTMLATTVSAETSELEQALRAIAATAAPTVLGAHLEGPFLSPSHPGAMDPRTFRAPDRPTLERLLAAGPVRMMTLAPELPGALELITRLHATGITASLGHSNADEAETNRAIVAGASSATHLFNAMRPLHHRDPGIAGAALDSPRVNVELICDAVHVDPAMLRLAHRAARGGIRLVSDAIEAAGMPDGAYHLGHQTIEVTRGVARTRTPNGHTLAGSTLTMDAAVLGATRHLGLSLPDAIALATAAPARLLGIEHRTGAIATGRQADLVILDDELDVCGTLKAGSWLHGSISDYKEI